MGMVTVILDEIRIKELIAKEYKIDIKDIRFINGFGFVSAMFDMEENEDGTDN